MAGRRHVSTMKCRSGYLFVLGRPLERSGMDKYQERLPPIYAQHSGYRLVMGGQTGGVTFLNGGLDNLSVMLAKFPSHDDVSDFWWSDAYREAYTLRRNSGRFSAVALTGLAEDDDGLEPGGMGYLVVMSNPDKPGQWRRYADAFVAGVDKQGGTVLIDAGPESVERLESLMPGSHFVVARFTSDADAQAAWSALSAELADLQAPCEPVNVIALAGLPDGHPLRLTQDTVAA